MENKKEEIDATIYRLKVVTQKQKQQIADHLAMMDTIADIAELNQEIEELLLTLTILMK